MVCYEFESEEAMQAFVRSDTLRAMTRDYDARFGGRPVVITAGVPVGRPGMTNLIKVETP